VTWGVRKGNGSEVGDGGVEEEVGRYECRGLGRGGQRAHIKRAGNSKDQERFS